MLAALALTASLLGPHAVGFETTWVRDVSRPDVAGSEQGRLVPVYIWYPARKAFPASMRLADYVDLLGLYETETPSAATKRIGIER